MSFTCYNIKRTEILYLQNFIGSLLYEHFAKINWDALNQLQHKNDEDILKRFVVIKLLSPLRIYYFHDCLFVCLLAGLCKHYWVELNEKNQKMGLGPT